jgi:hypothetical protein
MPALPVMDFLVSEFTQDGPPRTILFPMNPEEVTVSHTTRQVSFSVLEMGTLAFPRGDDPYQVSWAGRLPGAYRQSMAFVKEWRDPTEIITQLHLWQALGTRLNIQVTNAPVVMVGFISSLTHRVSGGYGDLTYDITFIQMRELIVSADPMTRIAAAQSGGVTGAGTDSAALLSGTDSDSDSGDEESGDAIAMPADVPEYVPPDTQGPGTPRSEATRPQTHLVQPGDTLIQIALLYYQDDTQWTRIWEANMAPNGPLGQDYNLILVGQTLRLP